MHTKECGHCGYVGKPIHDEYSSLLIDVFAWVFAIGAAAITGIIYLAILGPLVTLWHTLTFRSHRCPSCGDWDMHRTSGHPDHRVRNQ